MLQKQKPIRIFAIKYVLSSPFPSSRPQEKRLLRACCDPGHRDTSKDKKTLKIDTLVLRRLLCAAGTAASTACKLAV